MRTVLVYDSRLNITVPNDTVSYHLLLSIYCYARRDCMAVPALLSSGSSLPSEGAPRLNVRTGIRSGSYQTCWCMQE
jgi:hypothetical protein